jgi:hypothetical protein
MTIQKPELIMTKMKQEQGLISKTMHEFYLRIEKKVFHTIDRFHLKIYIVNHEEDEYV